VVLFDTTGIVWWLLMMPVSWDLGKKTVALNAVSLGGMPQLEAHLRGLLGGNFAARWRGDPVPAVRVAPRTRGLGFLILPQTTDELRRAQRDLYVSLARVVGFGIAAWVGALTVASYITLSPEAIRAFQVLYAAIAIGFVTRAALRPAETRPIPQIAALGTVVGGVLLIAFSLLPGLSAT
jgi:hypothetical protein